MRYLALILVLLFSAPASAGEPTIGIYAWGFSVIGGFQGCFLPDVEITVRDLEQPLSAIEFSLDASEGLNLDSSCIAVYGATVTGDFENLTIRFDECLDPSRDHTIRLFSFWYGEEEAQSICLGPATPCSIEPPSALYESCDGQLLPLGLAAVWDDGVPDGCLRVEQMVPTAEGSWGTLKATY